MELLAIFAANFPLTLLVAGRQAGNVVNGDHVTTALCDIVIVRQSTEHLDHNHMTKLKNWSNIHFFQYCHDF